MKILSIVESMDLNQGGPPVVLRNQKKIINKNKKFLSILKIRHLGVVYLLSTFFMKKRRSKLLKVLNNYDIIHFHQLWSLKVIIIARYAAKLGLKYIFIAHGYLDEWSINEKYIKKKIFIKLFLQKSIIQSSAFFFSTLDEHKEAQKNINFPDFFVIPNGSDLTKYKMDKDKNINEKKIKKIAYFGRIHKKKGIEILLESIKEMPKSFFLNYFFEIVGPGETEYIEKIKNLINSYSLNEHVKLLSPKQRNEKISYLNSVDIFILPSYEEGDSIALKEAMSLGIPVIISEQCRMGIVQKANAGFIVKTEIDSLKESFNKLQSCDLKKMGLNARSIIENKFDNENCSKRLFKIYEDIYTGSHNSLDWVRENE